jgi:hypothetical protein
MDDEDRLLLLEIAALLKPIVSCADPLETPFEAHKLLEKIGRRLAQTGEKDE